MKVSMNPLIQALSGVFLGLSMIGCTGPTSSHSSADNQDTKAVRVATAAASSTSLTITSPAANASVSGLLTISGAVGSSFVNVAVYDASNGNVKIGSDVTPSGGTYKLSVDTSKLSAGTHNINVTAYSVPAGQSGGTLASASVAVNVAALPPTTLSITSPAANSTVSGVFPLSGAVGSGFVNVAAYDTSGSGAKIGADVTPSGNAYNLLVSTSTLAPGAHKIAVVAYSVAAGQPGGTSSEVDLTVNVQAVSVAANALTITSPASNASVSGLINITGSVGSDYVNLAVYDTSNGNTKIATDVTPSNGGYVFSVDTSKLSAGSHAISVTAYSVPAGQSGGTYTSANLTLSVAASSSSGSSSNSGSTSGSGTSSSSSSGSVLGGSSSSSTRNYLVGIFSDFTDTTTMNALGYQFDYTLNGSYQGDCLSCTWAQLGGTTNYPMIIDLHHIETSYSDFNAAASGAYNSGYTTMAQSLVPYANNIYAVRIDSEFNGAWSQWSPWYNNYSYNNGVSAATWIAGFRNYALIVRKYLPNAKIIWNPNTGQTSPMAYYPGDDVVDIIGIDSYTNPQYNSNSTQATTEQISGDWGNMVTLVAFAKQHGKAFGIPEWGDTYGDGVFITAMGQFINDPSNDVVFHSFWDSNQDLTYPGQLAAWPTNEAAYVKAFGGRKYTGTYFKQVPIP